MRKKCGKVVGENTHDLTEKGRDVFQQASDYLGPIASEAAERGAAFAAQAGDRIGPLARQAVDRSAHLAREAGDYLGPLAQDAKRKGARIAADTMDRVQPRLDEAIDKVSPAFESAYQKVAPVLELALDKLQKELLPRFNAALHEAAQHPVAVETTKRLQAATAALAGELELPEAKPRPSVGATIAKVAIASALLAGVAVAVKKFLAPEDSGWQTHQPSTGSTTHPTTAPSEAPATAATSDDLLAKAADATAEGAASAEPTAEASTEATEPTAETSEVADVDESATDEAGASTEQADEDDAAPFAASPYGAGSFVGAEPPEGFAIKGNERSMKFHVPGGGGYDRTIADVWFQTEEAAEAAGFTRAMR